MTEPDVLRTMAGDLPLEEVQLAIGARTWSILHTGALVTAEQELEFLTGENTVKRPYGIVLWPSAIALAHELATRDLAGTRVLELGAGTGLPGIVAASLGARVVQTDRQQLALHVCRQNAARNGAATDCRLDRLDRVDRRRALRSRDRRRLSVRRAAPPVPAAHLRGQPARSSSAIRSARRA